VQLGINRNIYNYPKRQGIKPCSQSFLSAIFLAYCILYRA